MVRTFLLAVIATLATATQVPAPGQTRRHLPVARPIAFVGCTVIDGTGTSPVVDGTVVIIGNRIVAAGPRAQIEIPADAERHDLAGATLLPGFINAHVHSGYRHDRLHAWAAAGVTTVRDLGGPERYDEVAALNRDPEHARIVAAGPFITVPNGYPIVPWGAWALAVATPVEAHAAVDRLADGGADIIKIALETGQDFGRTIPTLDAAQATTVVEQAHTRGLPVSAHITTSRDLGRALDAGIDDIAHMVVDTLSTTLARRIADAGIVWVPTLELWWGVGYNHEPIAIANLARFVAAGGTVALGTDFDGYSSPFQLGMPTREIADMRAAGMPMMDVIVAATRNAARVCNLGTELGTVEAGKLADLLAVDGDPLTDPTALERVRTVVRSGTIIRDESRPALRVRHNP
jgi:imidazolonepropionase-like amidohydrolase